MTANDSLGTAAPPGAVKVAWCEPWPLRGGGTVDVECRLTLADAIRQQRAARCAALCAATTDGDLLSDFVCIHWAWFVDAEGRRLVGNGAKRRV